MRTAVTTSTKALLASFELSYLIVKNKNPHTIGETLLLPAAIKMCGIMHGKKYAKLLKQLLSPIMQYCDAESMSEDIKEQLLVRIKFSPKSVLKIDESTDVAGLAQLLVFVRYCQTISQQKIFLGQTASASVQTKQQLLQDTRKAFKLKYSILVPT
jgi:hypothetical protein